MAIGGDGKGNKTLIKGSALKAESLRLEVHEFVEGTVYTVVIYLVTCNWHDIGLERARWSLEPGLRVCWTIIEWQNKVIKGASGNTNDQAWGPEITLSRRT